MHVCFSPDASLLATASDDKTVRLWNAYTGKHLATFAGKQFCLWAVLCVCVGGGAVLSDD